MGIRDSPKSEKAGETASRNSPAFDDLNHTVKSGLGQPGCLFSKSQNFLGSTPSIRSGIDISMKINPLNFAMTGVFTA